MRLAIAAIAIAAATPATAVSQFIVFGDSFVDAGAVGQFTGGLIPDRSLGYWYGRFSEGPTWVDSLGYANFGETTKRFNIANPAGTLPPPFTPGATNFAVGGARGSFDDVQTGGTIPSLPSQLGLYNAYLGFTGQTVDPDALYIINFGNNDVNLIQSLAGDPVAQAEVADAYVTNMTNAVAGLAFAGADQILVAGVPNPTEAEGVALQAALTASLDALEASVPFQLTGATLYRFDYFAFFNALAVDPTQFGLPADLDLVTPCLAAEIPMPGIDCTGYLSFDGTHVTRAVQKAISIEVANLVGIEAVPEPATWAMLIAGFGMIGSALRNRRGSVGGALRRRRPATA
jgi:phospholipase/lecithinase/hemolysin